MLNLLISIVIVYCATSMWESLVHWKILHANKKTRLAWKKFGGVFNLLRKAYFSHNTIHHVKTYKSNYYIQFESLSKKQILDSKLLRYPEFRIIGDRYGLSISGFWENTVFIAIPAFFAIVIFEIFSPNFIWIGLFTATMPMLLSKYIHPLLHEEMPLSKTNSLVMRTIVKSKYFSYIQFYHLRHHIYPLCNFNLLPGGDYLLGVARSTIKKNILRTGEYNRK